MAERWLSEAAWDEELDDDRPAGCGTLLLILALSCVVWAVAYWFFVR